MLFTCYRLRFIDIYVYFLILFIVDTRYCLLCIFNSPTVTVMSTSENFSIMKIVSGSFHQGDVKFNESAGLQCGINCIVSTCFSVVKKVSSWNQSDLDYILETDNEYFENNVSK